MVTIVGIDYELELVSGRGAWNGVFPFDRPRPGSMTAATSGAPIAVLTRASVRPSQLVRFYRSVPSVDRELIHQLGLVRSVGIGEWPIARQATFSIWRDTQAMTDFAYRQHRHRDVIRRTRDQSWYREEMFCRFVVTGVHGEWDGHEVMSP